ncbi:MAG: hypothetical protein MI919_06505 [Holophagales bacterium]|nr:hypothetical protein [Holophagales bacterium]
MLRRLSFGDPDPGLRRRTLDGVSEALAAADRRPRRKRWIWKPALATALLLLLVWALPPLPSAPAPHTASAYDETAARWLELDEGLARYVDPSLNSSRRSRSPSTNPKSRGSRSHGRYPLDPTRL